MRHLSVEVKDAWSGLSTCLVAMETRTTRDSERGMLVLCFLSSFLNCSPLSYLSAWHERTNYPSSNDSTDNRAQTSKKPENETIVKASWLPTCAGDCWKLESRRGRKKVNKLWLTFEAERAGAWTVRGERGEGEGAWLVSSPQQRE